MAVLDIRCLQYHRGAEVTGRTDPLLGDVEIAV